jgi:hypothetical protein
VFPIVAIITAIANVSKGGGLTSSCADAVPMSHGGKALATSHEAEADSEAEAEAEAWLSFSQVDSGGRRRARAAAADGGGRPPGKNHVGLVFLASHFFFVRK